MIIANSLLSGPGMRNESESKIMFTNNLIKNISDNFIDPAQGDLHLKGTATEAIDKGLALAEVVEDFDRQPREAKPDIGADEFIR